ncbi:MAG: methyltransferase domain-containing protein [Bacilli bacterium]|jgi:NOL1/NOP2/sun family putative RNA methylase|nr:methyltransferase domain-containing protein [Bacilli bacterium]NLN79805.1 methyltransferase domain-containing protein [Erysipelotrichia bacterium]
MDFKTHLETNFTPIDAMRILESFKRKRTYGVLLNTNKMSVEDFHALFPELEKHPFVINGFLYDEEKLPLSELPFHDLGLYYLQDPSAMASVSFLNILSGENVLDLCAAPGGKTIQASLILKNSANIIANDLSFSRAQKLISNVERLGLDNVIIINNDFSKIKGYQKFDKIILDVPCSGSMMFRKNKEVQEDWSINKVLSLQKKQKELIQIAYKLLKDGGELLYTTCSFAIQENEEVILSLLQTTNAFLLPLEKSELLYESKHLNKAYYLLPHLFQGEGQFICKVKKPGLLSKNKQKPFQQINEHLKTLKKYELSERYNYWHANDLYSLPTFFINKNYNIMRQGLKCFTLKGKDLIPHHHLSRYLSAQQSTTLTYEQFKKYFRGEQLQTKVANGYYLLSYEGLNISFCKVQNGVVKNLLPKGLRVFKY